MQSQKRLTSLPQHVHQHICHRFICGAAAAVAASAGLVSAATASPNRKTTTAAGYALCAHVVVRQTENALQFMCIAV